MKNIIYIRTPKCATTSGKSELLRYAKSNKMKVLDGVLGFVGDEYHNWKSIHSSNVGSGYNINLDHVSGTDRNINRLKSIMNPNNDSVIVGSIRDPLDRLVSNYFGTPSNIWTKDSNGFNSWYLSNYNKEVHDIFKGHRIFPDFWINNYLINYLGFDVNFTEEDVKQKYDMILFAEYFDQSMKKLSNLLDFEFKTIVKNKTKKPDSIKISDEVIELFKENNKEDYRLYEICKNLYL